MEAYRGKLQARVYRYIQNKGFKMSQATLSNIFTGKRAPTREQAEILEDAFAYFGFSVSKVSLVFEWKKGQSISRFLEELR